MKKNIINGFIWRTSIDNRRQMIIYQRDLSEYFDEYPGDERNINQETSS